jgi:hypothetical protein
MQFAAGGDLYDDREEDGFQGDDMSTLRQACQNKVKRGEEMSVRVLIVLISVFLLTACGSEEDAPADTPIAEAAPATAESAIEPTEAPADTQPTALSESTSSQANGTAGFRDNLATADRFVLALSGMSDAPEGQLYVGWLLGEDSSLINVGELDVKGNGTVSLTWNSPDSENLLGRFTRFQVTLETTAGGDAPNGPVVVAGSLEAETLATARRLFLRNADEPDTPLDTAFAAGLNAQTDVAVQHVQNAINAAAIGARPEMRSHLEHVINIIEGAVGPRFGDHDGNGNAENPGDGFGVLGYSEQIATLLPERTDVVEAAIEIQAQSAAAQDLCFEILTLEDMASASAQLEDLKGIVDELKSGPVTSLYQAAQSAIDFEVVSVEE